MSSLFLSNTSPLSRSLRTGSPIPLSMRIGKFFLMFSMTFLIGILSFFYLIKFTQIHTKGYLVRRIEIERNGLMTDREVSSTGIAKEKSLEAIRTSSVISRLVPVRELVFIKEDGAAIAQVGGPVR